MQLSILVFLVLQACSYSQPSSFMNNPPSSDSLQSQAVSTTSTSDASQDVEFDLSDYQWQHRIVLIFAPLEQSPAYQQQMQAWKANTEGMIDRDLKVVEVLHTGASRADGQPISAASAERLRQQFGVTTEAVVILVGKDSTEKQRNQAPVEPSVLFRKIDAMPMRQQEMRS